MSLLLDLGSRIRTASDELPIAGVAAAADRLRVAIDLLTWVRQASIRPLGVPQLAGALEHTEHAAHALLVAREELAVYLNAIGLVAEATPGDPLGQSAPVAGAAGAAATGNGGGTGQPPLRRWWCERVDALTGRSGDYEEQDAAPDSTELMRRIARAGDRDRLRTELVRSNAPVGLGLAALAPAALRNLATELLGRAPGPDDLRGLVDATSQRVRDQLPHLGSEVAAVLLGRVCRVPDGRKPPPDAADRKPPDDRSGRKPPDDRYGRKPPPDEGREPAAHPADAAIAGAVLVAALLRKLDHRPEDLDRYLILPEPQASGRNGGEPAAKRPESRGTADA
jgi:hypothetical protein